MRFGTTVRGNFFSIRQIVVALIFQFLTTNLSASADTHYSLDYFYYPINIDAGYSFGKTSNMVLAKRLGNSSEDYGFTTGTQLSVHTVDVLLSFTQISRFFCNHFGGYPRFGILISYSRLPDIKGNIFGLSLYFAPSKNYSNIFEVYPSIAIGAAYLSLPFVFLTPTPVVSDPESNSVEYQEEPMSEFHSLNFRKGITIDISPSIEAVIRMGSHWFLKLFVGLKYLPNFTKISVDEDAESKTKFEKLRDSVLITENLDVIIWRFGASIGYTARTTDIEFPIQDAPNHEGRLVVYHQMCEYDKDVEFIWDATLKSTLLDIIKDENEQTEVDKNYKVGFPNSKKIDKSRFDYWNCFGINMQWRKRITQAHQFILGIDLFWNRAIIALYEKLAVFPKTNSLRCALELGVGSTYNKLSLSLLAGIIFRDPLWVPKVSGLLKNLLYIKIEVDYKIYGGLLVGAGVKATLQGWYDDLTKSMSDIDFDLDKLHKFSLEFSYPHFFIGYKF